MRRAAAVVPAVLALALAGVYLVLRNLGPAGISDQQLDEVVGTAFFVAAGVTLVRLASHGLFAAVFRRRTGREAPDLLRLVVAIAGYSALFAFVYRYWLGRDISPILATSAVVTVVLGLALQDTLGNFFAGVSIQIDQPYQIGDVIRVAEMMGKVESISWRTTDVRTLSNHLIVLPNNRVAREPVEVFRLHELNRRELRFPGPLDVPPQRVIPAVRDVVRALPDVSADMEPIVRVHEFGESKLIYEVLYWVTDYMWTARLDAEILQRIWYAFARSGVPAPFPMQGLRFERAAAAAAAPPVSDDLIESVEIFSPLSAEERATVSATLSPRVYAPGEVIVRLGDGGESMFIVRRGEVGVSVPDGRGGSRQVAVVQRAGFFGEMALFTGEPRTADVRALSEAEVVEIRKPAIERLLQENAALAEAFSDKIAQRQAELAELAGTDPSEAAPPETILLRVRKFFRLA